MYSNKITDTQATMAELVVGCVSQGLQGIQYTPGDDLPAPPALDCHAVARYLSEMIGSTIVVYHEESGMFYHFEGTLTFPVWKP